MRISDWSSDVCSSDLLEVFTSAIRQHKEIKGIQIGQEEVQLSLFTDDMILYMENPKDFTKKLLELIHEFSKVAGYKINAQKLVVYLYTNNETSKREIKESISFTVAQKNHKIPRNKSNQRGEKSMYRKLYKPYERN